MPTPAGAASLLTLPEVKAHLNFPASDDGSHDVEIQGFIDAAADVIREECDDVLPVVYTEAVEATGDRFVTGHAPVLSVSSLSSGNLLLTSPLTALDPTGYTVNQQAGLVRRVDGRRFGPDVSITYLAGRVSVPAAVRLAALELVAEWWQHSQQGPAAGQNFAAGAASQYDEIDAAPGYSAGVPYRVLEMLKPYRRAPRVR